MFTKAFFVLLGASLALATNPKANEYKSGDCSGAINYGHASVFLFGTDVTMDDTSNSVYTNGGSGYHWNAYSGKTGNGGSCTGSNLGKVVTGCHNLNKHAGISGGRIKCLRNVEGT